MERRRMTAPMLRSGTVHVRTALSSYALASAGDNESALFFELARGYLTRHWNSQPTMNCRSRFQYPSRKWRTPAIKCMVRSPSERASTTDLTRVRSAKKISDQ